MPCALDQVSARDLAVCVDDLYVEYRAFVHQPRSLKSRVLRTPDHHHGRRTIQALNGISVQVPRKTALGVIGANGAGKSTLLRAISGILPPTSGRIVVRGKVSTLLSLGVGFNKSLTGRENVILGGLAAGLRINEINEIFDEILEFAGIGDFIDLPMRTYSSGMSGRLAFAVSVCITPDILVVDEALSTGDGAFKRKSNERMRQLIQGAGTLVVVSHGLQTILDLTTHCLWIDKGRVMEYGEPQGVVKNYKRFLKVGDSASAMEDV